MLWFCHIDTVPSIIIGIWPSTFRRPKNESIGGGENIFDTIVNNGILREVSMILFLNKYDLLVKKVANPETDIRWYFPQFTGNSHSIQDVQAFILAMFTGVKRDCRKVLFHHFTTAVDTENIKIVFNYVKETILQRNLQSIMLDWVICACCIIWYTLCSLSCLGCVETQIVDYVYVYIYFILKTDKVFSLLYSDRLFKYYDFTRTCWTNLLTSRDSITKDLTN